MSPIDIISMTFLTYYLTMPSLIASIIISVLCIFILPKILLSSASPASSTVLGSIFDFTVEDGVGKAITLSNYRGKAAYLIVNVASE